MTDGKENSIAGSLSAILDMQKRLVETTGSLQTSVSESRQAIDRVHRDIARMRDDQIGLANDMKAMRQEMSDRFVAVGRRFDEVDNSNDSIRGEIRSAQKEIIAQELQTLNAVQEALTVGSCQTASNIGSGAHLVHCAHGAPISLASSKSIFPRPYI